MKLWLLRHAQVDLGPGLCYGASDVSALADATRAAAEAMAPMLPQGAPLVASGLARAAQLAAAVLSLRPDLQTLPGDPRLNEMHFGQWELQPWNAIPRTAFDAWMADFAHHRFGGMESTQQVLDRVHAALNDWRSRSQTHMSADVIWVTHAGVIRAVQYLAVHGSRPIHNASEWPVEAPAPGGHLCIEV